MVTSFGLGKFNIEDANKETIRSWLNNTSNHGEEGTNPILAQTWTFCVVQQNLGSKHGLGKRPAYYTFSV